jgi:hypothetical protein
MTEGRKTMKKTILIAILLLVPMVARAELVVVPDPRYVDEAARQRLEQTQRVEAARQVFDRQRQQDQEADRKEAQQKIEAYQRSPAGIQQAKEEAARAQIIPGKREARQKKGGRYVEAVESQDRQHEARAKREAQASEDNQRKQQEEDNRNLSEGYAPAAGGRTNIKTGGFQQDVGGGTYFDIQTGQYHYR